MISRILIAAIVLSPATTAAQGMSGFPAADSAMVARTAWARAAEALQRGQGDSARRELDRAAAAWPTQPAYVWTRAILAARAGDTTAMLDALTRYADLGLGRDLRAEKVIAPIIDRLSSTRVASLIALHDANRSPLTRGHVRVVFRDSSMWPEGMDVDPRSGRFYVASVRHRTIVELDSTGHGRELWPRDQRDLGAILGVRVDTRRGVLWATTSGIPQMEGFLPADSAISGLLEIRIADGSITRRWNLPIAPGGRVLGDLAIGPRGDVFVTDSNEPVLFRLRPESDTLETFRSPLFHSLQGLAPTPDGAVLYLADYSHGLLRVDLATSVVTRLADAPHSTSLGCDGLAWDRGAIVAVQNGVAPARIMRFVLNASGSAIARADVLDRNVAVADEPTIGAILGGEFIYVATSQWDKHDATGKRIGTVPLGPVTLVAVPLPTNER